YSCAYDALLNVFYNIWAENTPKWSRRMRLNEHMNILINSFEKTKEHHMTLEQARDDLRIHLNNLNRMKFPMRRGAGTSVADLCETLLATESMGSVISICTKCHNKIEVPIDQLMFTCYRNSRRDNLQEALSHSVKQWLKSNLNRNGTYIGVKCCRTNIKSISTLEKLPRIIAFHLEGTKLIPDKSFSLTIETKRIYHLRGLVYFGEYHFTSRFITKDKNIWFNDGMVTGRSCTLEGNLRDTNLETLLQAGNKTVTLAIYAE
ncbi:hypothetical protein OE88DRAFT_1596590, partial [Heliocybe sulcata]